MRWLINIASSYLKFVIGMVVVFLLTPYIVDKIGVEQFGLWSLVFALIGLFGLMDFGFATAAVKYVAEAIGAKDEAKLRQTLSTLFAVYSLIGLITLLVVGFSAQSLAASFELPAQQQDAFQTTLWILGLALALQFPTSIYRAAMTGAGRMDLVNAIALFMQLTNAALTVWLLEAGWGLRGLAVAAAVNMVGQTLLLAPFAHRQIAGFSLSPRHWERGRVRELMSFSVYAFLANIAVLVILKIDPVVIKMYLPLTAVAIYAIAAKIAEYAYLLNKQFSNALMPLVSQSHGAGDASTVKRVLLDGTRILMAIALPFLGLLYFHAPAIIELWMGAEFAQAGELLRILLIAIVFSSLQLNAANVLGMTGQHRQVAFAMIGSAALNLLLSIVLVQFYQLTGIAMGTLIAAFVIEMGIVIPKACRSQGIAQARFWREAVWPALPAVAPMAALAFLLDEFSRADSYLAIISQGSIAAAAYLLTFWFTGLKSSEREGVYRRIRR